MSGLGPFDLTGGPFLMLYCAVLAAALVAALAIPRWLRPDGCPNFTSDPDEIAYLAGGATRFAEALVTRLIAAGGLTTEGTTTIRVAAGHSGRTSAERSVLALPPQTKWAQVTSAIKLDASALDDRLVAKGLLQPRGGYDQRAWQTLPLMLAFAFGFVKYEVGVARDKPVEILTVLLVVTAVVALIRFLVRDRRTRAGEALLREERTRSERLRRAPTGEEAALAVALFGTTVLVGSQFDGFHKLRTASSGDGGSSSDGGSGCGGGGGGCGGCGS